MYTIIPFNWLKKPNWLQSSQQTLFENKQPSWTNSFSAMTQFESFHLADRLNIIRERKQCNEGVDLSKIYVEPRFIDSVHLNQMHDNCVVIMTFAACLTVPRIYDLD